MVLGGREEVSWEKRGRRKRMEKVKKKNEKERKLSPFMYHQSRAGQLFFLKTIAASKWNIQDRDGSGLTAGNRDKRKRTNGAEARQAEMEWWHKILANGSGLAARNQDFSNAESPVGYHYFLPRTCSYMQSAYSAGVTAAGFLMVKKMLDECFGGRRIGN